MVTNYDSRFSLQVFFTFDGESHATRSPNEGIERSSDDPIDVAALAQQ